MGNPYAPTRLAIDDAERARRDKAMLLKRLRLLGLDDEGLADVEKNWDNLNDDDWTPQARAMLARASDVKLLEAIRARDTEYSASTQSADDQDLAARERAVVAAETVAVDKLAGTVAQVME